MRRALPILLSLFASCASTEYPLLQPINKLTFLLGDLDIDENDYEPVEETEPLGVVVAFLPAGTGVGAEVGILYSKEDEDLPSGAEVEGTFIEVFGGMRLTYGIDRIRPYLSLGLAYADLDRDVDGHTAVDDTNWGVYLGAGVDIWVSDRIALGVEYRELFDTEIELGGLDSDIGYDIFAVTVSFNF